MGKAEQSSISIVKVTSSQDYSILTGLFCFSFHDALPRIGLRAVYNNNIIVFKIKLFKPQKLDTIHYIMTTKASPPLKRNEGRGMREEKSARPNSHHCLPQNVWQNISALQALQNNNKSHRADNSTR